MPLSAVLGIVKQAGEPKVTLNGGQEHLGRGDTVLHLKLEVTYSCEIPIGNWICLGARTLTGEAALPNNGAHYEY